MSLKYKTKPVYISDIIVLIGFKNHIIGYQFKTKEYWRNQVLFIQKGCVLLQIENRQIKVRKGNIIIFPKKSKFTLECLENYEGLFIVDEQIQFKIIEPVVIKSNPKFNFFYGLMEEEFKKQVSNHELNNHYASCILLNLATLLTKNSTSKSFVTTKDWAQRIKNILENGAYSNESTEVLLRHLDLSYRQLSRCFQKEFKISIKRFLIQLRVKKAQELLMMEKLSVSAIAYDLGFSSSQHLSLQFKDVLGLPPLEWLKTQNKK